MIYNHHTPFWKFGTLGFGRHPVKYLFKGSFWARMDYFWWKMMCPYPDQTRVGMWWYAKSGYIASLCHRRHCEQCKSRND